jgi:nucleoside 2-deoxyribosyltransferase
MDCPICKLAGDVREKHDGAGRHVIGCPRCGDFAISGTAFAVASQCDKDLKLSAWLRSRQGTGAIPFIASGTPEQVKSGIPSYTVGEKQTLALNAIASRTEYAGKSVNLAPHLDFVLGWCGSEEEFVFILGAIRDRGLLSLGDVLDAGDSFSLEATVTAAGWDYLDTVARTPILSQQGFVAMSFAPDLTRAWSIGIEPAVRSSGYAPFRVDVAPHIDRIDAKIVSEIRKSRFLVADVTGQRPGVYFEAGFAIGLDIPVFWSVREDQLKDVHFDTRQYRHIVWKDEEELCEQLGDLLVAVLGRGPVR